MNLTPAEIDAKLAELDARCVTALTRAIQNREAAHKARQGRFADEAHAARLEVVAAGCQVEADLIAFNMIPFHLEFSRRGGWTRAFIVAGGHVHATKFCSTCNNGVYPTQFGWLTEFSGKTEAEVIEAAGSRACTVCYPDAPVDAPAGRLFHADEVAAEAARTERAAKAAKAAEKKAANAFGPYKAGHYLLDTVYKAKAFLTDGSQWGWDHPSFLPADRDAVAALLAAKLGTTTEAQVEAASRRAANR